MKLINQQIRRNAEAGEAGSQFFAAFHKHIPLLRKEGVVLWT